MSYVQQIKPPRKAVLVSQMGVRHISTDYYTTLTTILNGCPDKSNRQHVGARRSWTMLSVNRSPAPSEGDPPVHGRDAGP